MIDSAVTLFPEPDSPTIATVSRGPISNEIALHDGRPFAVDAKRGRQVADGEDRRRLGHVSPRRAAPRD